MKRHFAYLLASLCLAAPLASQEVTVEEPECLAVAQNAVVRASIDALPVGGSVRLYFRRLAPQGTFYWVEMLPQPEDGYWTVFPKPADVEQPELTESWWQELRDRDWMEGHDRDWLEDWLEEQENEAAEYRIGVYDAHGAPMAVSETYLVRVFRDDERDDENGDEYWTDDESCPIVLTDREVGYAQNLTIGETAPPQFGEPVYHWLCDGIVTRIDWEGVYRADEICRRCIVAWWDSPQALVPAAVLLGGGTTIGGIEASPSRP